MRNVFCYPWDAFCLQWTLEFWLNKLSMCWESYKNHVENNKFIGFWEQVCLRISKPWGWKLKLSPYMYFLSNLSIIRPSSCWKEYVVNHLWIEGNEEKGKKGLWRNGIFGSFGYNRKRKKNREKVDSLHFKQNKIISILNRFDRKHINFPSPSLLECYPKIVLMLKVPSKLSSKGRVKLTFPYPLEKYNFYFNVNLGSRKWIISIIQPTCVCS